MLRVSAWLGLLVALAFAVVLVASSSPNTQREAVESVFNLPFTTKVEAERTVPFSPKVDPRIIVNEEPSKHFSLSRLMNVRDTHDELDTRSCIPGGSSEVKATLETCCWYNDATCCNKNLASVVVPYIKGNLSKLQSELGFGDQCYFAIADLVCMICSPNTATFIKTVGGSFQVHICDSLCEKIYGACMNDLNKIPGLGPNIKNGEQFCAALFKDAKAKGNIVFGKKDDGTCYDGVPLEQVEKGYCLPGQKPPSDSGDGDSAAKLALIVVPIVLGFVLLAVAIAGVVAYVYYRKRVQRQQQMDIALQDVSPWVN